MVTSSKDDAGFAYRIDRKATVAAGNVLPGNTGFEIGQVFCARSVLAGLELAGTNHGLAGN